MFWDSYSIGLYLKILRQKGGDVSYDDLRGVVGLGEAKIPVILASLELVRRYLLDSARSSPTPLPTAPPRLSWRIIIRVGAWRRVRLIKMLPAGWQKRENYLALRLMIILLLRKPTTKVCYTQSKRPQI